MSWGILNNLKFGRIIMSLLLVMIFSLNTVAQTVNLWMTEANKNTLLTQQSAISLTPNTGATTITLNSGTAYQSMDGFGFCLTEGSAEVINSLNATQQSNLLNEVFNPTTGIGVSVLRISIGASDLSSSSYSYADSGPDANLNNFSLNGPDLTYVVPLLKKILQINPNIKILGTPWSPPRWMKTNNAWVGGSLQGGYYSTYALYFVKYIQAMQAQGIPIWAITVQNEPENPWNEPSMSMNATEQTTFVNNNLGPAFQNAGISTKIIAFDHNCDNTAYPTQVLNGSSYVDGAGFHLYAGNISAMSTVHNATGKNVYFTEQFTSSNGNFGGDFPWHMQNVMIGSANNWGKIALEWNLATNASYGPKTPGGCTECLGAITIPNNSSYTKNVSFYIVGQLSKFVKPGAVRIQSSTSNGSLSQVALKNTDGSIVVVVYNSGGAQSISIGDGSKSFTTNIPGSAAVTYVWSNAIPSTTGLVNGYKDCNYAGFSGGLNIGDYTTAQLNAIGILDNDISSFKITEGYKVIGYDGDNFTGTSVEYTSDNSCVGAFNDKISSLKILPNGITNVAGTYFLQNRNSGLFMDVFGLSTADGANIAQGTYNGGLNQQYEFTHIGDGAYQILAKHSNKAVDVSGGTGATQDGANIQQWTNYSSANQQFIVVPVAGGFYKLIAKHSGKMVEVANAGMANGDNVQQWTNNNQTCGQWKFKPLTTQGTGTGLAANYFNGMNFEILKYSRVDANINFDWGNGSPNAAVNAEQYSARWTGQIQPKYTEEYTFYINSDNGRRLWINNQLVIDKWLNDVSENTGKITLTAGQKYDIKLEYFEDNGGATCKLEWSSFMQDREVIQQSQLYANTLPTVSIISPANNAGFTAPASIAINATAGDGDGTVAKIDFYNGITLLGSDASSPFNYNWTGAPAGTFNLTALATDNRGGVTLSSVVTVKVNQAPTVSITAPANNVAYVASANVAITATAGDSDGSISKVEFYNGSTLLGTVTASPYTYNWTNVTAGTYTITAKATDNLNAASTSTAITVKVNANQNPTVSITSPANNATFTSPAAITINATAADADGTVSKVEFYNGTTKLGEDATSPYSYAWTNVLAGTYTLTAKAIDDKTGSASSATVTIVVNIPNSAPAVSITSPVNNANYVAAASITINATASDNGSVTKVEFYNGTTLLGTSTTAPYSYNWTNVTAGTYFITAKAYDNLGLSTSSAAIAVKVNANQIPTVSVSATSTSPNTVTISATATDVDGTIAKVEYYDGTTKIGESTSSPFTYTWSNTPAGTHSITVKAIDDKGGNTTSAPVSVTVNNPNKAPIVSITSPFNNSTFNENASIIITADASDSDGSIAKVEFYNGLIKLGESINPPYVFDWSSISAGSYNIKVVATDNKGLTNQANITIKVEIVTSVVDNVSSSTLTSFPNPVIDRLYFNNEIKGVTIFTVSGHKVKSIEFNGENSIDLSDLSTGMYLVEVTREKSVDFIKVTKE